jgi:hypothetical protein
LTKPVPGQDTVETVAFVAPKELELCLRCHESDAGGEVPSAIVQAVFPPADCSGAGNSHRAFNCYLCHSLSPGSEVVPCSDSIRTGMQLDHLEMCSGSACHVGLKANDNAAWSTCASGNRTYRVMLALPTAFSNLKGVVEFRFAVFSDDYCARTSLSCGRPGNGLEAKLVGPGGSAVPGFTIDELPSLRWRTVNWDFSAVPPGDYTLTLIPRYKGVSAGPALEVAAHVSDLQVSISVTPSTVFPLGDVDNIVIENLPGGGNTKICDISKARQTKVTIDAQRIGGGSAAGLSLRVQAIPVPFSGGHDHDQGRPSGELGWDSDGDGRFEVTGSSIIVRTDSYGKAVLGYQTSGIAGEESIIVAIPASGVELASASVFIENTTFWAGEMTSDPNAPYVLVGTTPKHTRNHWGRKSTFLQLLSIAMQFQERYPEYRLRFNDISIEGGGPFDLSATDYVLGSGACCGYEAGDVVNRNWNPPHRTHREGKTCDIGHRALQGGVLVPLSGAQWTALAEVIGGVTGYVPDDESRNTDNWHYHSTFD